MTLSLVCLALAGAAGASAAEPMAGDRVVCTVEGTNGPDALRGSPGDDIICPEGGDDVVRGLGGDDYVYGGDGDDLISGGAGSDHLIGERGRDDISGDAGSDYLYGEIGDDALSGGAGRDALYGGPGRDDHAGGVGFDHIVGGSGKDTGVPSDSYPVEDCPSTGQYCHITLHLDIIAPCPSFTRSYGGCFGTTKNTTAGWAVPMQSLPEIFAGFSWFGSGPIDVVYKGVYALFPVSMLSGWVPSPNAQQFAVEDAYTGRWNYPGTHFYTPLGKPAGEVAGPLYINFVNGRIGADIYLDGYLYRK